MCSDSPFLVISCRVQEIFPQGSAHLAVTRLAEAFSSAKLPVRSVFRANDPSMKVRSRLFLNLAACFTRTLEVLSRAYRTQYPSRNTQRGATEFHRGFSPLWGDRKRERRAAVKGIDQTFPNECTHLLLADRTLSVVEIFGCEIRSPPGGILKGSCGTWSSCFCTVHEKYTTHVFRISYENPRTLPLLLALPPVSPAYLPFVRNKAPPAVVCFPCFDC